MGALGIVHIIFGLVALAAGTGVVLMRKGGPWHRAIGHIYFTSMVGLNVSGLFIFRLFGSFGPFHWLALASLLTLVAGLIPVLTHRPKKGWLERHAAFMNGSYVGLLAATAAEITTRLPGTDHLFGPVVGITSALVMGIGAYVIHRTMPGSIRRSSSR